MSYEVMGQLFQTRKAALTHLVAEFVSAGGENDLDTIRSALHEQNHMATAEEILAEWGDGETVGLGPWMPRADVVDLANQMILHPADIIAATDPADVRARREAEEGAES